MLNEFAGYEEMQLMFNSQGTEPPPTSLHSNSSGPSVHNQHEWTVQSFS